MSDDLTEAFEKYRAAFQCTKHQDCRLNLELALSCGTQAMLDRLKDIADRADMIEVAATSDTRDGLKDIENRADMIEVAATSDTHDDRLDK